MSSYDERDVAAKTISCWCGEEFALLNYPAKWRQRFEGVNDTTRLVLDFKEADADAIKLIASMMTRAAGEHLGRLRDTYGCGYVVAAPRSHAGQPNIGCEAVARSLASHYPFLVHLPGALRRVTTLAPSHSGADHSVDDHVRSICYAGPSLTAELASRSCPYCGKAFRSEAGFAWHLDHTEKRRAGATKAFLLIDDVTTHGSTGEACRRVLKAATGAPRVIGFYVSRTNGC